MKLFEKADIKAGINFFLLIEILWFIGGLLIGLRNGFTAITTWCIIGPIIGGFGAFVFAVFYSCARVMDERSDE